MIAEASFNKVHLCVELFIGMLLLISIGLLSYQVFKPPLITQETIEDLKRSALTIERYTKELQIAGSLARQQIDEDNAQSQEEKSARDQVYLELLSKYGIKG